MKKIKLTQNQYTLVDDADFDTLNQFKWYADKQGKNFYAKRNSKTINGKQMIILMHRFIMKTPKGMHTDHIDGNGLNNQRSNLRICTRSENLRNQGKQSDNSSGFKGVSFFKRNKKWVAQIMVNGKYIYLGYFTDKEKASNAYITACKKYHKEFANYK
jgi:hypothetical protein